MISCGINITPTRTQRPTTSNQTQSRSENIPTDMSTKINVQCACEIFEANFYQKKFSNIINFTHEKPCQRKRNGRRQNGV